MAEIWIPIITAIIGAIGTILAAVLHDGQGQKEKSITSRSIILFGALGLIVGAVAGLAIAFLFFPTNPCASATIEFPQGTKNRVDAAAYIVSSDEEITWKPSDCVMVVQYYQNESLVGEYKNIVPGTELNIGVPDSGETQIKIWRDGLEKPSDNIWVWVGQ